MEQKVVTPYSNDSSKKEQVAEMFDNISHKYDFLNHFLSMGIDKLWRKKAIKMLKAKQPKKIIDIATGTGDFAIAALKINPEKVVGVDISKGMVEAGIKKIKKRNLDKIINLTIGDSENLPFETDSFDALTVGFGVRNFENLEKGLGEMLRVIKPNGQAAILEFSKPKKFPVKHLFGFYSKRVMPTVGKMISKDSRAYTYLPESVEAFPEGQNFIDIMEKVGYKNITTKKCSGGIATIYLGEK